MLRPGIAVGTPHEDPVILTRQDWRMVGPDGWGDSDLGFWQIQAHSVGTYQVRFLFGPASEGGTAELKVQQVQRKRSFDPGTTEVTFEEVPLEEGEARLEAVLQMGGNQVGVRYVEISAAKDGGGKALPEIR